VVNVVELVSSIGWLLGNVGEWKRFRRQVVWNVGSMGQGESELYGGVLVDSGGDVDLGVGDEWDGHWVSKDSVKPRSIVPIPLISGEV